MTVTAFVFEEVKSSYAKKCKKMSRNDLTIYIHHIHRNSTLLEPTEIILTAIYKQKHLQGTLPENSRRKLSLSVTKNNHGFDYFENKQSSVRSR